MTASKRTFENAYSDWEQYVDRYFANIDDPTADEVYPTLHDINNMNNAVASELPRDSLRQLINSGAAQTEKHTTPLISLGESLRSKKGKVHDFLYQKMGKEVPNQHEGFFDSVLNISGQVSNYGGGSQISTSEYLSSVGTSRGSTASDALKHRSKRSKTAYEASPIYDDIGSQSSSRLSGATPIIGPALGPSIKPTNSNKKLKQCLDRCEQILKRMGEYEVESLKVKALAPINYIVSKKLCSFKEEGFGYDGIRNSFQPHATKEHIQKTLTRAIRVLSKTLPKQLSSTPSIRPIIFVPSSVTSAVNIRNARSFLAYGKWEDPLKAKHEILPSGQVMKVDRPNCPFTDFLIRDNVKQMRPEEWPYVCAILVSGQKWQFEGFFGDKVKAEPRAETDENSRLESSGQRKPRKPQASRKHFFSWKHA
eukprot:TRINITY_DN4571_c0_g1_i1.p1 TRINITY_DN4571_c0_g1~~TRINITY_DN4571_c0_g1_i1.p1  ORF type:complete len:423 (+),score=51.62 TRINITY_DN4571_c0_g1_i1:37-1305(+)